MRNGLFLALLFAIGCNQQKVPKDLLPPDKMQVVFWDYLRADVFANEYVRRDTSLNVEIENARLQNQVFQLHKTSREQFYNSYEYYLQQPGMMKAILDTMIQNQQDEFKLKDSSRSKGKINILSPDSVKSIK
jgi:hypothetical protein